MSEPLNDLDFGEAVVFTEPAVPVLPDAPKKHLSERQLKAVSYIEQKFWETGKIPTNEQIWIGTAVPVNKIEEMWKDDTFRRALVLRGIDLSPETSEELLTPIQLLTANLMLNTHDKRTTREKLAEVEISSQQWHAWLRQPAFASYLRSRAEAMFSSNDFSAYQSLNRAVDNGDLNAVKLHFEMRDIYNPKVQVDINVEMLIVRLVEIVAKHVTDPTVLEAVAAEVETLQLR